ATVKERPLGSDVAADARRFGFRGRRSPSLGQTVRGAANVGVLRSPGPSQDIVAAFRTPASDRLRDGRIANLRIEVTGLPVNFLHDCAAIVGNEIAPVVLLAKEIFFKGEGGRREIGDLAGQHGGLPGRTDGLLPGAAASAWATAAR